ncbi:MAG: hypothetical protein LBK04_02795 [Clostridiales Family XIII bacterium]|nr:hypothetical protein [Clostridiales Family XIII bacterium]
MRELLVAEFKNSDNNTHYAVVGVTAILKEEDSILIKTENPEKDFHIDEGGVKEKDLSIQLYYPNEDDILRLHGNDGLFKHGIHVVDGRLEK